jgi:hypothetical protein
VVAHVGGLRGLSWASPWAIAGLRPHGAGAEHRGLQGLLDGPQRRLCSRFARQRGGAEFLQGVAFVVTRLAPLLSDGALCLRLAVRRVDEDPALLHATRGRCPLVIASAVGARGQGLRIDAMQSGLGFASGRWDPGKPREGSGGERLKVVVTIESTLRHESRGAGGRLPRRTRRTDDGANLWALAASATAWLQPHGPASLGLAEQLQHDVVQVWLLVAALPAGARPDVGLGLRLAVGAPIAMKARAIKMGTAGGKAPALGRRKRTPSSRQKRARMKIDCYTDEPQYTAAGVC